VATVPDRSSTSRRPRESLQPHPIREELTPYRAPAILLIGRTAVSTMTSLDDLEKKLRTARSASTSASRSSPLARAGRRRDTAREAGRTPARRPRGLEPPQGDRGMIRPHPSHDAQLPRLGGGHDPARSPHHPPRRREPPRQEQHRQRDRVVPLRQGDREEGQRHRRARRLGDRTPAAPATEGVEVALTLAFEDAQARIVRTRKHAPARATRTSSPSSSRTAAASSEPRRPLG